MMDSCFIEQTCMYKFKLGVLTAFVLYPLVSLTSCAQQTTMPKLKVCCRLPLKSDTAKLIKLAKICIWDEAPMMHRNTFEAVDKSFIMTS